MDTINSIWSDRDSNPEVHIKAIIPLNNGSLLIETTTIEEADWLRSLHIGRQLIEKLGIQGQVKAWLYSIIVPSLSTSLQLNDPDFSHRVEEENRLPHESLVSARWIKPVWRRVQNQTLAHAIFTFNVPHLANSITREGLFINAQKLFPWKDKRKPKWW